MIMPEKVSLSDFVARRLHPVKVTIQLMSHELDKNTDNEVTSVNAALFASAINTLELFVEDYEKLMEKQAPAAKAPAVERKFVGEEAKK
jgi:hypothetical protein